MAGTNKSTGSKDTKKDTKKGKKDKVEGGTKKAEIIVMLNLINDDEERNSKAFMKFLRNNSNLMAIIFDK